MSNIFTAAKEGDLARVEELLAQGGVDLAGFYYYEGCWNLTALYAAAHRGHMDVSKALIRAGEDYSPLHSAVYDSHYDLTALLLRQGADVDARTDDEQLTPLGYAEDRRVATLLIAAGADVNAGPSDGPLHRAALHGRLGVLQELLAHPGINVNKKDERFQSTPLHNAAASRHPECVAALLAAGADACIADAERRTPLSLCFTYYGDNSSFRIVAMLVAAGDRQWAYVPSPCPGLEATLLSVWKEAPQELPELAARLTPEVKRCIQVALCVFHHTSPRHLPDHIRMRLLDEAFNV